jgi:hypothetical protein
VSRSMTDCSATEPPTSRDGSSPSSPPSVASAWPRLDCSNTRLAAQSTCNTTRRVSGAWPRQPSPHTHTHTHTHPRSRSNRGASDTIDVLGNHGLRESSLTQAMSRLAASRALGCVRRQAETLILCEWAEVTTSVGGAHRTANPSTHLTNLNLTHFLASTATDHTDILLSSPAACRTTARARRHTRRGPSAHAGRGGSSRTSNSCPSRS